MLMWRHIDGAEASDSTNTPTIFLNNSNSNSSLNLNSTQNIVTKCSTEHNEIKHCNPNKTWRHGCKIKQIHVYTNTV